MKVLGLVRDLFFRSKIDAVANAVGGIELAYASTLDAARGRMAELSPAMIFVDLSDGTFTPAEVISAAAAIPDAELIGFASHVDMKVFKSAREAGFKRVLSKQEFTAALPALLSLRP